MYREGRRIAHVDFFSRNYIDIDHVEINKIREKEINLTEVSKGWSLPEQRRDFQFQKLLLSYKMMSSRKLLQICMNHGLVPFAARYQENAGLSI